MRILIDEGLPRYLKRALAEYEIRTVQEMGWAGIKNGPLLRLAETSFDVFLTGDKNLRYQQNLAERRLSFVVLPSNRLSEVKRVESKLKAQLQGIEVGSYIEL